MFRSVAELVKIAEKKNISISEVMIQQEMDLKKISRVKKSSAKWRKIYVSWKELLKIV